MHSRLLVLILSLSACTSPQPNPVNPAQIRSEQVPASAAALSPAAQPKPTRLRQLSFKVNFSRFSTQCVNCKVRYAKLEIKGSGHLSTPIYALGANANGFTPVDENEGIVQISAQVPEGNNWSAYASLYATDQADQTPLAQVGNAFHNPNGASEQDIELSLRALQVAQIVESLHTLNSPQLLSPLELDKFQQLSDSLLGVRQQPDGTYSFDRMPALDDPSKLLDADAIARMLDSGQLNPDQPEAAAQVPISELLPQPSVVGGYRARSMTGGLTKLVMNPLGQLFSFDRTQSGQRLYSLQTPAFSNVSAPYTLGVQSGHGLRNRYLSLGQALDVNQSPKPAIYAYEYTGLDTMSLKALAQDSGSVLWSRSFSNALVSDYVPTLWRSPQETSDTVYLTLSATDPQQSGVYAVHNGQQLWQAPIFVTANNNRYTPTFANAGALSPDGSVLYVIRMSYPPFEPSARLYAVATAVNAPERVLWSIDLGEESFASATPAIGHDGQIYVSSYHMPAQYRLGQALPGKLQAISPQGTRLWSQNLASATGYSPVIDRQQGQDVIYLCTDMAQMLAFNQDGSPRWNLTLRGTAGEGPVDAPLIGADIGGTRTLYQALGNGLIYAVRDHGPRAELLWAQAPGGKVKNGMVLHQGHLYAPTLDGGEGQFVQIKAIQVHSQNLPPQAPWPLTGGNLSGSGLSHRVLTSP